MKRKLLLLLLFFFLYNSLLSQEVSCTSSVNPPTIINNISIISTFSGSVQTYPNSWTSCSYTTPPNSIYIGQNGSFIYTMNFSSPVNDLIIILTATGTMGLPVNEIFNFTTNTGNPNIYDIGSCFSTISGNTITSGSVSADTIGGGGGIFKITNSTSYTSITISGPGGHDGSLLSICSNSVINRCDAGTISPILSENSILYNCSQNNINLNSITANNTPQFPNVTLSWFSEPNPSASNQLTYNQASSVFNNSIYYAAFYDNINSCYSNVTPINIIYQNTPAPTGNINQSFCSSENATLNSINISGTNIIWYDSANGNNILPNSTYLTNGITYYASQIVNGCESQTRLAVTIQLINTLNANNYSETICDDLNDGNETVNLVNYNNQLISSSGIVFNYYSTLNGAQNSITSDLIQNPNNYDLSIGNNICYVRIESPNSCFQVVPLSLTLVNKPFININDIMPICEGNLITVDAGTGYNNYLWSTGEISSFIEVNQPGNYSVTVTENHGVLVCSTTKNFTIVTSNIGTISEIITSDWTQNENTISILLSSNSVGDYEYSLNGIDYQNSNTFTNLENGEYTIYIRDKNGCGISSDDFYLLMYPKFFTPNNDGYNDLWKIKFSENEPNLNVIIFDRFGKLITSFGSNSLGWDGTSNGNLLPSTDYWFVVTRENGKEYRGHFSLKR
jgi:gliding motility-associated-like protein